MNGQKLLEDFSHVKNQLLIIGVPTRSSYSYREKHFLFKARTGNFTAKQIAEMAKVTNLSITQVSCYGENGTQKDWHGMYKGIIYSLSDDCETITFSDMSGEVLDTAKVKVGITFKELIAFCKQKIDTRSIFI